MEMGTPWVRQGPAPLLPDLVAQLLCVPRVLPPSSTKIVHRAAKPSEALRKRGVLELLGRADQTVREMADTLRVVPDAVYAVVYLLRRERDVVCVKDSRPMAYSLTAQGRRTLHDMLAKHGPLITS